MGAEELVDGGELAADSSGLAACRLDRALGVPQLLANLFDGCVDRLAGGHRRGKRLCALFERCRGGSRPDP